MFLKQNSKPSKKVYLIIYRYINELYLYYFTCNNNKICNIIIKCIYYQCLLKND